MLINRRSYRKNQGKNNQNQQIKTKINRSKNSQDPDQKIVTKPYVKGLLEKSKIVCKDKVTLTPKPDTSTTV